TRAVRQGADREICCRLAGKVEADYRTGIAEREDGPVRDMDCGYAAEARIVAGKRPSAQILERAEPPPRRCLLVQRHGRSGERGLLGKERHLEQPGWREGCQQRQARERQESAHRAFHNGRETSTSLWVDERGLTMAFREGSSESANKKPRRSEEHTSELQS